MRLGALALCALVAAGCSDSAATGPANGPAGDTVVFTEVAYDREPFVHHSGAAGEFLLPEIMCGGAGFLDYDGDGLLDLYLIDSGRLDGSGGAAFPNRLYRNKGNGRFEDVTAAAGVGGRRPQDAGVRGKASYGMGCATGDYDNDGDVDLYVTNLGPNVLYRNNGDGTFSDVTAEAGTGDPSWSTSSAFVDYDADGDLDLFVTNYVDWSDSPRFTARRCFAPSGVRDYCSSQAYAAPTTDTLYRNDGDGTFSDVSAEAGIRARAGTGLGVVCTDLNGDGRVDIYVANDQMPSFAWISSGDGRFTESAAQLGCAVDEMGKSQAGMGVASADLEDDGDFDLWKVHLHRESHILYLNRGGYFDDATSAWGLAAPTRRYTGFGTALFDYDLDGLLDAFVANGRVQIVADTTLAADVYAEPDQLLRQVEEGRFEDVTMLAGPALERVENSRAAAFGDYDNDGDIDILVANRDGPARLLRNDAPRRGNFLSLRVLDRHGRDAIGATLRCTVGARVRTAEVRTAYSYCAANDPRVHLGLGPAARVDRVEVRWPAPQGPGGDVETFGPFEANQLVVLQQNLGGGDLVAHREPQEAPAPGADTSCKEEFLEIARRLRESRNPYFGRTQVRDLQAQLSAGAGNPAERVRGTMLLSMELLRIGEVDAACAQIEEATRLVQSSAALEPLMQGLQRIRGIVYLRKAEVENCIRRHSAECCIFPLRGGGVHELKTPAQLALQSYQSFLERDPGDLKIRWLLNVAHMAYGDYPDGVPEPYLIPPATFESDYAIPRYPDVGPSLGVDTFNLAGGCVADDFDGDGFLDIVTSTCDPEGPLTYYRNSGTGTFEDRSAASRLDDQLGGLNMIGGDYDNDGDVDLLVLRGGWLFDDGQIRKSLLRNNGDGTWSDVTRAAGMADPPRPTQTATWGDFDNDGDLDLFVGNESRLETGPPVGDYPCQLYDNNGDGTFTEVARAAGVRNDRFCKGVTAGDYDNDGDLDLYLSNNGPNRLYRNNADGTFTDVAPQAGVTEPSGRSFATWFFDYDNDGWLDLWVGAFDATVDDVAADSLGLPRKGSDPRLYRNNRDGSFANVTAEMGLAHAWLPMGANFGDLDNDGFLDFYLGTGDPDFQTLMPNVMLRNDGGRRFQDVTTAGGFGHLQKGHGVAFADLDNDGDQDIYHQLGGFYPGDTFANALFLNPGPSNHFLYVKLVGTRSNRSGAGARIKVEVETESGGRREIHRAAGSVSSFGGSPLRQEIGLGDARRIASLEIFWPASGTRQVISDVPLDALITVTEGAPAFETGRLKSVRFDS